MNRIRTLIATSFSWVIQPALVIIILVGGFYFANKLGSTATSPERSDAPVYAPLVRTLTVETADHPIVVHANGTIEARSRVDLVPQVGGRIVEMFSDLRPGGMFDADELLIRIEPRDYELMLARANADVVAANTTLQTQLAEAETAVAEWDRLHPDRPAPPLVARTPYVDEAEAMVRSAEAARDGAQLDLDRTVISMPFAGRVVMSSVERGEVVAAGQAIAVLYSTERFEVRVPLELDRLVRLQDSCDEAASEPTVIVELDTGGVLRQATGRLARIEGELDSLSRMCMAVIEVDVSAMPRDRGAILIPGLFVNVEMTGGMMHDVVPLAREYIRDDGNVWLIRDGRIQFVRPEPLWMDGEVIYARGLPTRAEIVVSELQVVTDGMEVRVEGGDV